MRRQPLHETRAGSVMTRRPSFGAQTSQCYHPLLPPPPSSPQPPLSTTSTTQSTHHDSHHHHHQLLPSSHRLCSQSDRGDNSSSFITSWKTVTTGSPVIIGGHHHDYHHAFKTSISGRPFELSNVLTQVGRLSVWKLLLMVLVLSLLTPPAMCKPWIDEQPDKVTFRTRLCQPVTAADLRRRMGTAFDDATMAADMGSAKNLLGDDVMSSWNNNNNNNKGMDGYQSDGPAVARGGGGGGGGGGVHPTDRSASLVEAERFLSSGEMYLREEGMLYRGGNSRLEEREEIDFGFDDNEGGRVEEREDFDVDVDVDDDGDLDIEKKTLLSRRSWLPRRRMLSSLTKEGNSGMSSVYNYKNINNNDNNNNNINEFESGVDKDDGVSDSYKYMRRRRRRRRSLESGGTGGGSGGSSSGGGGSNGGSDKFRSQFRDTTDSRSARKSFSRKSSRKDSSSSSSSSSWESSKKHKSLLPLRLSVSGKLRNSRKLRKQLKKEFRQQSRKLNKPPPWECKMYHKAVFMKKDVFPRVLIDGRCGTDKCFYRLYNCEPNKYAIKLLQRDENHCNPLPIVGNTTVYEERWNIITRHITVGCNCASLVSNGKGKNRRKV